MSLLETARTKLDELEITNTSKMYTPFTLFCVYFAIYFNADILGQIFLSNDWAVINPALKTLVNRTWQDWFSFVLKVVSYSLGMLVVYGIGQAASALIWSVSNMLNTKAARLADKDGFVSKNIHDKTMRETLELKRTHRELHVELSKYKDWRPEDIRQLENENLELNREKQDIYGKNKDLESKLNSALEESDKLQESVNIFDGRASRLLTFIGSFSELKYYQNRDLYDEDEVFNYTVSKLEYEFQRNPVSVIAFRELLKNKSVQVNHSNADSAYGALCASVELLSLGIFSVEGDSENGVLGMLNINEKGRKYINDLSQQLSERPVKPLEPIVKAPSLEDIEG